MNRQVGFRRVADHQAQVRRESLDGAPDRLLIGLDAHSRSLCGLRGSFVSVRHRLFPEAVKAF